VARCDYLGGMLKLFDFCIPTAGKAVPAGPEWFHEIKYDGYRLFVVREENRVRLITKGGHDWTKRFPRVAEAALKPAEAFHHRWRGHRPRRRWLFRFQLAAFGQGKRKRRVACVRYSRSQWRRHARAAPLDTLMYARALLSEPTVDLDEDED
jgi:hypothetical protein